MSPVRKNTLLTGPPGSGKTTAIKKLMRLLEDLRPVGFVTEEIRDSGVREGFRAVGTNGEAFVLAHADIRGADRVGQYGVDVEGFESFLLKIPFDDPSSRIIIIDEIGRMECLSREFDRLMTGLLDSERPVVATVAIKGGGLISGVKRRGDVAVLSLTAANRDSLPIGIADTARAILHNA